MTQDQENDFYEVLPIIRSELTDDSKVARIKVIFERLLHDTEQTAREEGYKKGKADGRAQARSDEKDSAKLKYAEALKKREGVNKKWLEPRIQQAKAEALKDAIALLEKYGCNCGMKPCKVNAALITYSIELESVIKSSALSKE